MVQDWRHRLVSLATVGLTLGGPALEAEACFGWLRQRTACQQYCNNPAQVAQSTCAPQVVTYQPITCYRAQYVQVPVVTYRPQHGFDPCSGVPTTCLRPTTSYVVQQRYVPYTTYRLVYSNPCATNLAPAAAVSTYYAPAASYAPAATGCASCSTGATTSYVPSVPGYSSAAPLSPSYAPAPSYAPTPGYVTPTPVPSSIGAPTSRPELNPTQPAPGATFQNGNGFPNGTGGTTTNRMSPIPDTNPQESTTPPPASNPGTNGASGQGLNFPRLNDPNARTTQHRILPAWSYSTVAWREPVAKLNPQGGLEPVDLQTPTVIFVEPTRAVPPADTNAEGWSASRR